ncbi:hypothetical protein [Arthrobacter sp. CDRTa11]|uniref:WXG100 family type VII secretion target n=1 Tax=Arthrobacter sp. CDRTa11 TaxID=2651199 RepID=UPI002B3FFF07|nr:hypothetical protein [Arthrobacter sp. CDRTa11]
MDLPDKPEAAGEPIWIGSKKMKENTMAIWGADVEGLRTLSTKLNGGAEAIEAQKNELNSRLEGTQWMGPDADKFRSEWSGTHMTSLSRVVDALREAGTRAGKNADEQTTASA